MSVQINLLFYVMRS